MAKKKIKREKVLTAKSHSPTILFRNFCWPANEKEFSKKRTDYIGIYWDEKLDFEEPICAMPLYK